MTATTLDAVDGLLSAASDAYSDDFDARRTLTEYRRRLNEPLRIALAGMLKAGKSTLLNALIGDEIAPTDAGECTTVVTWYRYGDTPRVTLHLKEGPSRPLPVTRCDGRLCLDLGGVPAEDVARIVVDWPASGLRDATLIDTPGIASLSSDVSARSIDFLIPADAPSEADAVIYLMRHLHASDLSFLHAFRDTAVGRSATVNAVAVLSRADEIGAGRIDALLSAREIADRYRRDGSLRALALGVVPIAGLLAQSARTLRESEFAALTEIANLDRDVRERMLVSSDRFARPVETVTSTPRERTALLERFGIFGIRLASVLIASGATEAPELADRLARRSGLGGLHSFIEAQFHARAAALKARTALLGVERLLQERPRSGAERVAAELERIQASAHEYRELRLLATARTSGLPVVGRLADEAERLIGGDGVSICRRLGLAEGAPADSIRENLLEALERWRSLLANPLTDRSAAETCQLVVRSCEAMLSELPDDSVRPIVRLALAPEPGSGAGKQAHDERRTG